MKYERRYLLYIMMLLGLAISGIWLSKMLEKEASYGGVALVQVRPSQVIIAWESEEEESGIVKYHPIGSLENGMKIVNESGGPVHEHEVKVEGLLPGTRYVYSIGRSEKKYHFQTPPEHGTAFSFMILWGEAVAKAGEYLLSEMPSFYLLLSEPADLNTSALGETLPYVSVFSYHNTHFFQQHKSRVGNWPIQSSNINWAGLNLLSRADASLLTNNSDALVAHANAVVLPADRFQDKNGRPCTMNGACIEQSSQHAVFAAYNRQHADHPVCFVILTGLAMSEFNVGAIKYIGLPTGQGNGGALRVDVHRDSIYATVLGQNKEIVLKAPPIAKYRTCEDCRRLATRGAYRESIAAYRDFIVKNNDHYQLDDAYYAIADILDTKLFRYEEAIDGYRQLATRYPKSALTPFALQRIEFIQAHADYDYEPLKRFENIKRSTSGNGDPAGIQKNAGLAQAEKILLDFPRSVLAPTITYWLANQYRSVSSEKAIHWYENMIKRFPDHPDAQSVWWDIALVHYSAEQYTKAMQAFKKAKLQQPGMEKEIDAQMQRVNRNRLREGILWSFRGLLVFLIGVSIFIKPIGFEKRTLWIALIVFFFTSGLYSIAAWLIHEQFSSFREIVILAGGFAALVSMGFPVSRAFTHKIIAPNFDQPRDSFVESTTCFSVHCIFMVGGGYQILYHTNRHYLVTLGL